MEPDASKMSGNIGGWTIKTDEVQHLWYKLCVYYHAKTELYDRTLTNLRSPYDPTEAYIQGGTERGLSCAHARKLRQFINRAAIELNIPEDIKSTFVYRPPAQHWIDEYNRLVANGEMDFINELE